MKKRATLAVSLALALSMLAGCGTTGGGVGGDGTAAAGTVAAVEGDAAVPIAASQSDAAATTTEQNAETHDTPDDYIYDEADVIGISLGAAIEADSDAVNIDGTTATINAAGTYRITGTLTAGQLVVDAGDDAVVQLILDDTSITNAAGAAVAVMTADKVIVILADGSVNTVTDGADYVFAEGEDEPNAALYSASDLTITGGGSLVVAGNYNDAIASKDGLVIDDGDITVVAADDGIRGKDYVVVNGGTLTITSGGDGIKADNDADPAMGYISVSDGTFEIAAGGDGIQAATDVVFTGGEVTISAGGGSSTSVAGDESAKGVKGAVGVVIEGGTFAIDTADDAIHSNASVVVNDGTLDIATGDDAIHADETVEINGGTITVTTSYEGIEATIVTINGGDIQIVASDDGLNVAGGVDASGTTNAARDPGADAFGGPPPGGAPGELPGGAPGELPEGLPGERPGGGPGVSVGGGAMPEEIPGEYYLYINGGVISIDAYGDGIDSNGYVVMTGGTVTIDGSTSSRDGAVDHNGTFEMNGGTLIGTNIDGMVSEGIDSGSQASLYVTTTGAIAAGTVIHIATTNGEGVLTYETSNDFSVIVFSSPDLVAGESYNIYIDGTAEGEDVNGLFATDAYTPGMLVTTAPATAG